MDDVLKAGIIRAGFTHSEATMIIELAEHGWQEAQEAMVRVANSVPDYRTRIALTMVMNTFALKSSEYVMEEYGRQVGAIR